jgi:hypothetical protein
MASTSQPKIEDAPDGCGYVIRYIDRDGCKTSARATDYGQAQRFAAAVARNDNDAMNGRIGMFR